MKIEIDGVEYIPTHEARHLLNVTDDEFKVMPIGTISTKRLDNRTGPIRAENVLYKKQDILDLQKFLGITVEKNDSRIIFAGVKHQGFRELAQFLGVNIWQVLAWERLNKLEKEYED